MSPTPRMTRHLFVAAGLAWASSGALAINITLPTSLIDAESVFRFDAETSDVMDNMGIGAFALGNTSNLNGSRWNFLMPVTQVTVNASIFPLGVDAVSGFASGSGLLIQSEVGQLSLANFGLDFKRNVLTADLGTASGIRKSFDVFNFKVAEDLHLSTSGGLSMKMNLTNMMLTDSAQLQFASALNLDPFAVVLLPVLNFGSLSVDINPSLRLGLSDKPLVAPVPEVSTMAMLAAGMLGIAFVSRRRLNT